MPNASSRWFWNDWQGDPALRACTLAAQGLWMRLLCVAAESDPYGHVLINGRKPTVAELSRICGEGEAVLSGLIEELDRNGVFSRTRGGVIYSRRMVRDAALSAKRSVAGAVGGQKTQAKTHPANTGETTIIDCLPKQNQSKRRSKPETVAPPSSLACSPEDIKNTFRETTARLRARGTQPGPNFDDPAVRKAAWEQKVFAAVRAELTDDDATALIAGYLDNQPAAKQRIERIWASRKAALSAAEGATG